MEKYHDGGKIPGEHELAELLGVNRGTIRQALNLLEQEGIVNRQQGDGTYANSRIININTRIDEFIEFKELIKRSGFEVTQIQLDIYKANATKEQAKHLLIEPNSPLLVSNILLLADGVPAIYVQDNIPLELIAEEYDPSELEISLFDFVERRCHTRIDYVTSEITSRVCGDDLAKILKIEAWQSLLQFRSTVYNNENEPIMYSTVCFRTDIIRYHAVLKRKY